MASGNEQDLNYQQAQTAYVQGNYQQAAETIDSLVLVEPENAKARLLRGHVYSKLQDYALAQAEYESVLEMSTDLEIRSYAQSSLEEIHYVQSSGANGNGNLVEINDNDYDPEVFASQAGLANNEVDTDKFDSGDFDSIAPVVSNTSWDENADSYATTDDYYVNPFDNTTPIPSANSGAASYSSNEITGEITYKLGVQSNEVADYISTEKVNLPYWAESDDFTTDNGELPLDRQKTMLLGAANEASAPEFADFGDYGESDWEVEERQTPSGKLLLDRPPLTDESSTFLTTTDPSSDRESFLTENWRPTANPGEDSIATESPFSDDSNPFMEGFGEFSVGEVSVSPTQKKLDNEDGQAQWTEVSSLAVQNPSSDLTEGYMVSKPTVSSNESFTVTSSTGSRLRESASSITSLGNTTIEPRVTVKQGWLRPLENADMKRKSLMTAIASGIASTVVVGVMSLALSGSTPAPKNGLNLWQRNALLSLGSGLATFGTTLGLITLTTRSIRRSIDDLDSKLQDGIQGNFNTSAIVFSEDEFGRLSTRFNQMAGVMLAITSEAQRKAQEEEQKKEDLQRQVIRLLDDVEGAARGDLTVQAEVTADVLGAVADSFNLTIENLREIVQQVKTAAQQVNQESTASEVFARNLSGEALRQAEELAVTLNSVQVITDSIKRVADSAKEAENVARSASLTALKGGDAVEKTVEGILGIRETVAESTRKVKRLAESSQEISKIVAVISQIASRTNMLALNASIEAARAGEAGRGFAIVADEVRQLADRSAKALKEIEQIVRQIQSDTGSVMMAMEEGTQQVIEGTKLAEKAKRSLEDIITVSNRIDSLVQSITADTVEQTQTSTTVAQVMQSVEMTAQATSQEAQRVSGTLQNLVSVAQDLLNSVERFRVENN